MVADGRQICEVIVNRIRASTPLILLALLLGACAGGGEHAAETTPTPSPEPSSTAIPTATRPSLTGSPAPEDSPTWSPEFARVFQMLPVKDDLPSGFVVAGEPHSTIAPESGEPRPPNARVQFELAEEPKDESAISCLQFYVVQLADESEAHYVFETFQENLTGPSRIEGQSVEALAPPAVGDETAASTLASTKWSIGSCGTRLVYSYAGLVFRSGTVVADVYGFTPRSKPNPELVFEMARLQLSRIDEVRAND